jgi:predicted Zn-dependent protease
LLLALAVANPSAQTKITPDKNSYSVADDVKVGQEAAAAAKKQLPMLNDDQVDKFVERVGARLAAAIDGELRHAGFRYTFDVVNQKEINAFALPGGPMFLNRGMIEAAKTEAEMAGVMAHEIAHVALRHGTAQATKGQKFQIGAVAGQILGAIVGGTAGSVISQGSQFGIGAYFLKSGREYGFTDRRLSRVVQRKLKMPEDRHHPRRTRLVPAEVDRHAGASTVTQVRAPTEA